MYERGDGPRDEVVALMQRALVVRAREGDLDAFSQLVKLSFPRLERVADLILRDADRAQDAVQEALMRAWRDLRALRDPDAWDAWMRRLTVNACYDVARSGPARGPRPAQLINRAGRQRQWPTWLASLKEPPIDVTAYAGSGTWRATPSPGDLAVSRTAGSPHHALEGTGPIDLSVRVT